MGPVAAVLFLNKRENPTSPGRKGSSVNEGNIRIALDASYLFAQNDIWKVVVRSYENSEEENSIGLRVTVVY